MPKPAETLTLTEARAKLLSLADRLERDPGATVSVTKHGRHVLTLVSASAFEALSETLEILADEGAAKALRKAVVDVEAGRGISWDEARKALLR